MHDTGQSVSPRVHHPLSVKTNAVPLLQYTVDGGLSFD